MNGVKHPKNLWVIHYFFEGGGGGGLHPSVCIRSDLFPSEVEKRGISKCAIYTPAHKGIIKTYCSEYLVWNSFLFISQKLIP